jgi:hypothetical protein
LSCVTAPVEASSTAGAVSYPRAPIIGPRDIDETGPLSMLGPLGSCTGAERIEPPLVSPTVRAPSCMALLSSNIGRLTSPSEPASSPALFVSPGSRTCAGAALLTATAQSKTLATNPSCRLHIIAVSLLLSARKRKTFVESARPALRPGTPQLPTTKQTLVVPLPPMLRVAIRLARST